MVEAQGINGYTTTSLFSEKLKRYGAVGAGVIPDTLSTLRCHIEAKKETLAVDSSDGADAARNVPLVVFQPSEESIAQAKATNGRSLQRDEVLQILAETVRVQGIVQQQVSELARKLAKERGDKKSKKQKHMSFIDAHKKIQELGLPREPLEQYGLSEADFQRLLLAYENDEEVMIAAQQLLHPAGKGDPERARGINIDKIIHIHQFMVQEMKKVLAEFLELPQEVRRSYTSKGCETTAELLVSIAVEQHLSVRCEDVEQAVIMYEEALQNHPDFAQCTEQLAQMMQHLMSAAQPRVEKEEFIIVLQRYGDSTKKAKVFAKKLYEDYRSKVCGIAEAYRRFEEFSDEVAAQMQDSEVPDLSSTELRLCYDEYKNCAEVRQAWEQAGIEAQLNMQAMMTSPTARSSSSSEEKQKGKKLKSSEVVEMQELMVDELKRTVEAVSVAIRIGRGGPWKAELAVQMVQALGSAAVERRYGVSAEEMTCAGFQNATVLQRNERFVRATEKQQELLMQIPNLLGAS